MKRVLILTFCSFLLGAAVVLELERRVARALSKALNEG